MPAVLDQLKQWREQVGRHLLRLDFEPLDDTPFGAELAPVMLDDVTRFARCRLPPGTAFRDSELVRDGENNFTLLIAKGNPLAVKQRHRDVWLLPGEAMLLRNDVPGWVASARSFAFLAINLPADKLPIDNQTDSVLMSRIPTAVPALGLLKAYIAGLEDLSADTSSLHNTAARHLHELAGLALAGSLDKSHGDDAQPLAEARVKLACDYIAQNYREPGLSLTQVARQQNISQRYLQKLFERAGIRYADEVNKLRLSEAHRRLTNADASSQQISDIAFASGFSDLSHFNRLFRRRFDASPTAVRDLAIKPGMSTK